MRIKITNLLILLFVFSNLKAQESTFDKVEEKYFDYFRLNHETIYTQLNKTKFLLAEDLWFKTYIYYTKTQKPYRRTTNVYASIFDSDGNLIDKKLFHAKNGMTHGNFDLKPQYPPGTYYLKVSTNWMRNFKEDHFSFQKFEILNSTNENDISLMNFENNYDFQILPEGGNSVNNVNNNFGFKVLNKNGESEIIKSGYVIDNKKNKVTTFKSNKYGMGQFRLTPNQNENYTAVATLHNDSIIETSLPTSSNFGIVMNVVNNQTKDNLLVSLKTNNNTLPKLSDKTYFILVHRDGFAFKVDITFKNNKNDYLLKIPKDRLHNGINILTLFNDLNQPISERLTYCHSKELVKHLVLLGHTKGEDSTTVRIGFNGKKDTISKNISVSVLPSKTKSYNQDETILSKFLISPYLNGHIEEPNYYFNTENPKAAYDLETLLITQGWSKYSWNNIFNSTPIPYYPFEFGITINGTISSSADLSSGEIMLVSGLNEIFISSNINSGNKFNFEKLYLSDDSRVFFSLKDERGKVTTPKVYFNSFPNLTNESVKPKYKTRSREVFDMSFNMEEFVFDDLTILDTVNLEHRRDTIRYASRDAARYGYYSRQRNSVYRNAYARSNRNYDNRIFGGQYGIYSGRGYSRNVYGNRGYFDTQDAAPGDFNQIYNVHNPMISSNLSYQTTNTLYQAESAPNYDYKDYQKKVMIELKNSTIEFGFSKPDKYYAPYYNKTKRQLFTEIGVLHWIPNLTSNEYGIFSFKIPNYFYDSINLYINGMADDGTLFSKVETIKLK